MVKLESERLILKRGIFSDYLDVYEYDFKYLSDINDSFKMVKSDKFELLNRYKNGDMDMYYHIRSLKESFEWIIYLKEGKIPVGNIIADRGRKELNALELGFNLHPNYWGKGIMSESVSLVINYLIEQGYENFICSYVNDNKKSKKLLEKIGFEHFKYKKADLRAYGIIEATEVIMPKDKWLDMKEKVKYYEKIN